MKNRADTGALAGDACRALGCDLDPSLMWPERGPESTAGQTDAQDRHGTKATPVAGSGKSHARGSAAKTVAVMPWWESHTWGGSQVVPQERIGSLTERQSEDSPRTPEMRQGMAGAREATGLADGWRRPGPGPGPGP